MEWIARTGTPWRELPKECGNGNSVYQRFARWQKRGIGTKGFEKLAEEGDFEDVFLDSRVIGVHQPGVGAPKKTALKRWGDPEAG